MACPRAIARRSASSVAVAERARDSTSDSAPRTWFVYVLRCAGDRLYCGIATDVGARFQAHCGGRGAKFTRAFPPEAILAIRECGSRSEALREEAAFKRLRKSLKLERAAEWMPGDARE